MNPTVLAALLGGMVTIGVAGVLAVLGRMWKPVDDIAALRMDVAQMKDRLSLGASTMQELKNTDREQGREIQELNVQMARLTGSGRMRLPRAGEEDLE